MTSRAWDRLGSASGVVGVLLALAGLFGAGRGTSATVGRPALDAPVTQIVAFMSQSPPTARGIGQALSLTAFVFLLLFFTRLWATLRTAEGGVGWLATAGLAGGIVYTLADLARFVVTNARYFAAAHMQPGEAVALFDLSNALTPLAWTAIGMFMIPSSVVAVRTRVLPIWLGWAGLVIGVANVIWGWLPPGGTSTPAEFAFIFWLLAVSVTLFFWKPLPAAS